MMVEEEWKKKKKLSPQVSQEKAASWVYWLMAADKKLSEEERRGRRLSRTRALTWQQPVTQRRSSGEKQEFMLETLQRLHRHQRNICYSLIILGV
ncbi:unnamed protein product [Pleuronectes platessa]|uniref:Uncharacterized protein n=1 Tax=Pleuronectes platessa TaxID=8262 RepID=A0A9N7YWK3_PLEPL|nr:unnamed protein product [Pleuronectes platessa]